MVISSGKAKFLILSLIFIVLFGFSLTTEAKSFQNNKENTIEDSTQLLSDADKEQIEKEGKRLPEIYKIIVLPTASDSIQETAKTYFEHRQFSQDTIMILILSDDREIFVMTGEALQKKGLDTAFFEKQITEHFVPSVKDGNITAAISNLMNGISNNIAKQLADKNEKKDAPKIPEPQNNIVASTNIEKASSKSNPLSMISGSIIILLIIIWFVLKIKKKK